MPAAADWPDAVAANDTGGHDEAITLLMPLASEGNVGAQLLLFDTYSGGAARGDRPAKVERALPSPRPSGER